MDDKSNMSMRKHLREIPIKEEKILFSRLPQIPRNDERTQEDLQPWWLQAQEENALLESEGIQHATRMGKKKFPYIGDLRKLPPFTTQRKIHSMGKHYRYL